MDNSEVDFQLHQARGGRKRKELRLSMWSRVRIASTMGIANTSAVPVGCWWVQEEFHEVRRKGKVCLVREGHEANLGKALPVRGIAPF